MHSLTNGSATPTTPSITLTEAAIQHFRAMLQEQPQAFIVFNVEKTGCSGFGYATSLTQTLEHKHHAIPNHNNLPLYIHEKAIPYLNHVTIDYRLQKGSKGLPQKTLVYTNPNETGRCGCGESFTIDPQFSSKDSKRA